MSVWVEIIIYINQIIMICVTLHVSVWVEIFSCISQPLYIPVTLHVSVWVEITYSSSKKSVDWSHAPRERVSWNSLIFLQVFLWKVTLHVSVWVEIDRIGEKINTVQMSRSTWACELKYYVSVHFVRHKCHAPRERVSWNINKFRIKSNSFSHAPRERVSWNGIPRLRGPGLFVTLHVSVWVEIHLL